jgi:hypothetical protein
MYAIDIMNTTTEAGTVKTTKLFWFFGGIVCLIALGEHIYIRLIHEKYGTGKQLISREKLSSRIDFFKKFWGPFVVYVIATSIILLFIASFTLDKVITLTTMNEWVSMVLGMVALIIGVISLYLSFFNVDQANQSQNEMLGEMKELVKSINKMEEHMDRFENKIGDYKGTSQSYNNESTKSFTINNEYDKDG